MVNCGESAGAVEGLLEAGVTKGAPGEQGTRNLAVGVTFGSCGAPDAGVHEHRNR